MARKYTLASYRKQGVPILQIPPQRWHRLVGATTAPRGYAWWGYGNRFAGTHRHALVKEGK